MARIRMRLNPSQRQSNRLQKVLISIGAASLAMAALYFATSTEDRISNDTQTKIEENGLQFLGMSFLNQDGGQYVNNGQVYFTGDIENNGIYNCGTCNSGSNFLVNPNQESQTIDGSQSLEWYDGVLNNDGGLVLENELIIQHTFSFVKGLVETDRNQKQHFIHYEEDAVIVGAADSRHVDGYAAKSGAGLFTLPLGDGQGLHALSISPGDVNAFIKAAYFALDPEDPSGLAGAPFSRSLLDQENLTAIYPQAYWDVEGSASTVLELHWNASNGLSTWVGSIDTLVVAGWDGSQWINLGKTAYSGDLSVGSLSSNPLIPSNYQAFTLGKATPNFLPVEWLTFEAQLQGQDAQLLWQTAQELNAMVYEIQRASDATLFEKVGEVPALGNSDEVTNYDFTDPGIAQLGIPLFYFRLKQFDFDGQFSFSNIVELKIEDISEKLNLVVFPNPSSGPFQVLLEGPAHQTYKLIVINMAAQMVHQGSIQGQQIINLSGERWASGIYHVIVENEEQRISQQLIISK